MDDVGTAVLAEKVRGLVARFAPHEGAAIADAMELADKGGLGFDSVRIVELLLACEDELGVTLPVDDILSGPSVTVASLVEAVVARSAR